MSPHLDDAAFSVGGTLAALVAGGHAVRVVTCFTASVPDPSGFALACQLDKGLPADADYMALRRAEDLLALERLGVRQVEHLPFPEAPHRGYDAAARLFEPVRDDDDVLDPLVAVLAPRVAPADVVLAPLALGRHVDHVLVAAAVRALPVGGRVRWWRDVPYVLRLGGQEGRLPDEHPVALSSASLAAKVHACAAYGTQLGFQFGGPEEMSVRLRDHAAAEARRAGVGGTRAPGAGSSPAAEVLTGSPLPGAEAPVPQSAGSQALNTTSPPMPANPSRR